LGVILTPSDPDAREIGELLDLGIPLVAFDRTIGDPRADSVTTNNHEAGRRATQHLLDGGYTRIALISSTEVQTGIQRLAGYEEVMHAAGLRPQTAPGYSRIEGGRAAAEQLMWGPDPPEALIAGNGLTGIGALKALHAGNISVPDDVALVMIDDPFWAELVHPPVTALAQPVKAMAQAVVDLLVDRLKTGRDVAQHPVFEFERREPRASVYSVSLKMASF
jgi:DNA-binding LacI/PurR family transcriptional regulator